MGRPRDGGPHPAVARRAECPSGTTPDALSGSRSGALVLCARVRRARHRRRRVARLYDSDENADQRDGVLGQGSTLAGTFRSHRDGRSARADQQGAARGDHRTRTSERTRDSPAAPAGTRASRVFSICGDASLCVLKCGCRPERIVGRRCHHRGDSGACCRQAAGDHRRRVGRGSVAAGFAARRGRLDGAARMRLAGRHRLHDVAVHRHARLW